MPTSVVDLIFSQHEAVDPTDARLKSEGRGGGRGGGRGVQKAPRPPRRNFPASMMEITAKIKMEKAVKALGTIELCNKRQGQLSAQLTALEWPTARFASLGNHDPVRDPDEAAVYEEERARLKSIRDGAVNVLDELFGEEVGPPFNLQAAVQQRKAFAAQQALEAQMADMAMQEPESPSAVYASTGNPRFQGDRSDSPPPAFRSIGTDD